MHRIKTAEKLITLGFLLMACTGCTRYQDMADNAGLKTSIIEGTIYRHRIYRHQPSGPERPPERWHVYIEGDGRAVTAAGTPSLDPTPRTPLLLPMMALDPQPALYLGRPCYFHTSDPRCSPLNWTLARYSESTVASMAAALEKALGTDTPVTLIGHSGGGTLAVLLAPRLPQVDQVVTLAGNLQVGKWTAYHHYSPLTLSLDPGRLPPLPADIRQYHLAGARDREIHCHWIREYAETQPGSHFQQVSGADHRTGWPPWWTLINLEPTIKTQRCDKVTR